MLPEQNPAPDQQAAIDLATKHALAAARRYGVRDAEDVAQEVVGEFLYWLFENASIGSLAAALREYVSPVRAKLRTIVSAAVQRQYRAETRHVSMPEGVPEAAIIDAAELVLLFG